jgi:ADP-heptose:LPS heptosyltransferase
VGREYSDLLTGHPKIRKVWKYDRKSGLGDWLKLCRTLWDEGYDEVLDLHVSIRARVMRAAFFVWGLEKKFKSGESGPRWTSVSKQRFFFFGYYLFKKLWPVRLRPTPKVDLFRKAAGGKGPGSSDLGHLVRANWRELAFNSEERARLNPHSYWCVMPSSLWQGKFWPTDYYVKVIRETKLFPIILGTKNDESSRELCRKLEKEAIPYLSGVGRWSLADTAAILAFASGYLGNDTGLAHVAEAVGCRAWMLFGPNRPEGAFGPWQKESRAFHSGLWCSPCGLDGRFCFRPVERHLCMRKLLPEQVIEEYKDKSHPVK